MRRWPGRSASRAKNALHGAVAVWMMLYHHNYQLGWKLEGSLIDKGYLTVDVFLVLSNFIM